MRQTTPSEYGPLGDTGAGAGLGSLVMVLVLVGIMLASSYPRLALGVAVGLAIVPLARYTRGLLIRGLRGLRGRRSGGKRKHTTRSTTHR